MSMDLSKLPRWARHRIEKLEADLRYYDAALRERTERTGPIELRYLVGSDEGEHPRVPGYVRVRCYLENGGWVELAHEGDRVFISANEAVSIRPRSANLFTAFPEKD